MPPFAAAILFSIGILGLFYLDRDVKPRLSKALWIPAAWIFLISSRPVSMWLGITPDFTGTDATQAYVEGSPVERAVFTSLVLAALAVLFTRAGAVRPLLRKNALVTLFFLYCLVSISWSDFPFVALKRWIKVLGDLAMVLTILTDSDPLLAVKRLVSRISFLLFPLSILYIKYYPAIGRRLTNSWTMEPVGVTTQKNSLGLICSMYGVLFLWMFWCAYRERDDSSRGRRLLAYGTIIGMIVYLLIQCNSTTSIVGFIATASVMWLALRASRKPVFVHVLVLAVLGLSTATLFFNLGGDLIQALGKDATLSGRTYTWRLVLGLQPNRWLGAGFESFWLGPRLQEMRAAWPNLPINQAHNGYLEVYINLGWIGIAFIAGLLITAYKRVMTHFYQDAQTASLLLGFLLCTLFNAFTENAFRIMTPSWIFLLIVIVASSQAELFRNATQHSSVERDIDGKRSGTYNAKHIPGKPLRKRNRFRDRSFWPKRKKGVARARKIHGALTHSTFGVRL
jgi:O-antigen ligase